MSFIVKQNSTNPVPSGSHLGRLVQIIGLGMQPGSKAFPKPKNKVRLTFELPNETITTEHGESPRLISTRALALSLDKKAALLPYIKALAPGVAVGANFDLATLLDRLCIVNVEHAHVEGKVFANISGLVAPMKGQMAPDAVTAKVLFDFDDPNEEAFSALPNFMHEIFKKATNFKGSKVEKLVLNAVTKTANNNSSSTTDDDLDEGII